MYKLDLKFIAIYVLLPLQLLWVVFYVLSAPTAVEYTGTHNLKFVESHGHIREHRVEVTSLPIHQITLNESSVESYYTRYNGMLCYNDGTDINYMKHFGMHAQNKCVCKKGWHSRDCGQPEVIWRAFITSRQEIVPIKRKTVRRIIYACSISDTDMHSLLVETIFQELDRVVDLFVVYKTNRTQTDMSQFSKHILKNYRLVHHKIVYISLEGDKVHTNLWHKTKRLITDPRQDDLIVMMNSDQIPNYKALLYLKLYDGWPQPVGFRLRWSVYGFFWQHPKLTSTALRAAFTLQFLEEVMQYETNEVSTALEAQTQLVVGDLNHYGGWVCSLCLEPKDIIEALHALTVDINFNDWDQKRNTKIDTAYIQDLIGTGLWIDGVTVLKTKLQHKDKYFAPNYILNNSWQFDSLLINFYSTDYN